MARTVVHLSQKLVPQGSDVLNCPICEKSIDESPYVEVTRGLQTLLSASLARDDGLYKHFYNKTAVKVHIECRKIYTRRPAPIKDLMIKAQSKAICLPKEVSVFDIKIHCLFCGEKADKIVEILKKKKRKTVREFPSLMFQETVRAVAMQRNDDFGNLVLSRLESVTDLVALGAKYHRECYKNFNPNNIEIIASCSHQSEGLPCKIGAVQAFSRLCDIIDESNECQYSLQDLHVMMMETTDTETVYTMNVMKEKLLERYGGEITIREYCGKEIVSFPESVNKSLGDSWYAEKRQNIKDEKYRIVMTAAAIIREDIRSQIYDNSLRPIRDIAAASKEQVPETLRLFVDEVTKWKNGYNDIALERKRLNIEHGIIAAARPKSFLSSFQLSLTGFLHKRYRSHQLIDMLSKLGITTSSKDAENYINSGIDTSVSIRDDGFIQYMFNNTTCKPQSR